MFSILVLITLLAYLASAFLFFGDIAIRGRAGDPWGKRLIWMGLTTHVGAVCAAVVDGHGPQLLAMPGGLLLAALLLVAGYVGLSRRHAVQQVGTLVAPLACLLLTVVVFLGPGAETRRPAGDATLIIHITLAFVGTAAFSLAFLISVLYVVQARQLKRKNFGKLFRSLPSLDELDNVNFRCVSIGFPIYTAAILLGVIWLAKKEASETPFYTGYLLATSSWLLYGIVLQSRITAGWRGTKAAVITMIGFLAAAGVIVTYVLK